MPPERTRPISTLLILSFLIMITGCSLTTELAWIDEYKSVAPPPESVTQDPDLSPVTVEPEICLTQELEVLKRTGKWDDGRTTSQQSTVADFSPPEVTYDFPITVNRQVQAYIDLFQGKQREYFSRWLSRSGCYLPMMKSELEKAGLPLDLVYLSLIESGFSQRAYSRSRAVGLWQFMAGTGRDYGLEITSYLDERRDAEKSTKAAVAYLKDLYTEFGDWYLAVAAYNGGPGTIRRAVAKSRSTDFWKIAQRPDLPLETKRYVPKLIAAIMIAKEPAKYGFADIDYEKPLAYDTINVGPGLGLEAAALLTDSSSQTIKALNQELTTGKTPLDADRYALKIPAGSKPLAERNLPRLHSFVSTDYRTHIIGKGETLAQICRKYNVNTTTLLKVNTLKSNNLVAGSRLRIPFRTIEYRILPEGTDAALAAKSELILHTIKKGETISKISRQYQVPPELIVAWNGLTSVHKIRAGQQIALYMSNSAPEAPGQLARSGDTAGNDVRLIRAAAAKKMVPASSAAPQYKWYLVKNGDSLWTISRRFNTSPTDIKRLNNLKSNLIHPGNRLKLRDA